MILSKLQQNLVSVTENYLAQEGVMLFWMSPLVPFSRKNSVVVAKCVTFCTSSITALWVESYRLGREVSLKYSRLRTVYGATSSLKPSLSTNCIGNISLAMNFVIAFVMSCHYWLFLSYSTFLLNDSARVRWVCWPGTGRLFFLSSSWVAKFLVFFILFAMVGSEVMKQVCCGALIHGDRLSTNLA